jgi:hypothetical protein
LIEPNGRCAFGFSTIAAPVAASVGSSVSKSASYRTGAFGGLICMKTPVALQLRCFVSTKSCCWTQSPKRFSSTRVPRFNKLQPLGCDHQKCCLPLSGRKSPPDWLGRNCINKQLLFIALGNDIIGFG